MSTDLAELMQQAATSMPVDTARLVDGGLERGAARVRRRVAGWTAGVVGATVLAAVAAPGLVPGPDTAREGQPAGSATLQLLPAEELLPRFAAQLPGPSTPVDMRTDAGAGTVTIVRLLTNADGMTGRVEVDAGVSAPYDAEGIAQNKAFCREMHEKVGPLDGSDCVVVPGGIVQFWDDTVPPEDPVGNAAGIRLTYAYFLRWDGRNVNLRALNSTSADVPPAPGTAPVVRTDAVVDLVQRLDLFTRK